MEIFELFLRFSAIAILAMLVALILRDGRHLQPARFGILVAIGVIAIIVVDLPLSADVPAQISLLLNIISSNTPIFIWWFARSLFDDEFRLGSLELSIGLAYLAMWLPNASDLANAEPLSHVLLGYGRMAISLSVAAHVVFVALQGRRTDLVEKRRKLRVRVLFALAVISVFMLDLLYEVYFGLYDVPVVANIILLMFYLTIIIWAFFWLTKFNLSALTFEAPAAPQSSPALTPKEEISHSRLIAIVETEKAYLDPELSIGVLAARMKTPEHQVRVLINKSMGYRNFRAFLNHYKMMDVKAALSDKEQVATPILTIALDNGFGSLAAFNRAFKADTGQTPSAYRAAMLTSPNS